MLSLGFNILSVIFFAALAAGATIVALKMKKSDHKAIRAIGTLTLIFGAIQARSAVLIAVTTYINFFA